MTEAVTRELGKDYDWPVALMDQGQENISTARPSEIGFPGVLEAPWSRGRCRRSSGTSAAAPAGERRHREDDTRKAVGGWMFREDLK